MKLASDLNNELIYQILNTNHFKYIFI